MTAPRRAISRTERVAIFHREGGRCHICGEKIGLAERWQVEHVVMREMGGDEAKGSLNLKPAHIKCHETKTSVDLWQLAKAKRREAKHIGADKPRSRLSHPTLRKKLNGEVVPRD